eukprot:3932009-Rhodomonas_salina.5
MRFVRTRHPSRCVGRFDSSPGSRQQPTSSSPPTFAYTSAQNVVSCPFICPRHAETAHDPCPHRSKVVGQGSSTTEPSKIADEARRVAP